MPSCVVKICTNNSITHKKSQGITFHRFPADPERNAVWTQILRIQRKEANFNSNKYTRICSSHFSAKDFRLSEGGLRKLKKTAIPRLLIPKNLQDNNGSSSDDCDGMDDPNPTNHLRKIDEINIGLPEHNANASEDDTMKKHTLVKLSNPIAISAITNVKKQKKLKKTKSKGKNTKTTRQGKTIDNADIKIDYDNIDKFGEQIAFLLKRIPRKLCRELQDSIVTLIKTATKDHTKKADINVIPNITITSSVSKSVIRLSDTPLSQLLLPQVQDDYPKTSEIGEIVMKVEPDAIDDTIEDDYNSITAVEYSAQTRVIESFKTTQERHHESSVEVPKTMSTPNELDASTKLVKMEDHEANRDESFIPIFSNNSSTFVKIEIEETDIIDEANRRMYYDNN